MAKKRNRLRGAGQQFNEAQHVLSQVAIALKQHAPYHFQAEHKQSGWLINLYPSTHTVYVDPKRAKPPAFDIPKRWTLLEMANVIADAQDIENCRVHYKKKPFA